MTTNKPGATPPPSRPELPNNGFFSTQRVSNEFFPDGQGTVMGDAGTPFVPMNSAAVDQMRVAAAEITTDFMVASQHPTPHAPRVATASVTRSAFDGMA